MNLTKINFTSPLIHWFSKNKRELLFRKSKDPYAIWISEIMAQQTQINTMLPYYEKWMNKWPTLKELSKASEQDVVKAWEGLGYYSRARNILASAHIIAEKFNYQFPNKHEDILSLKGIGDYTASAISSIAFNKPTPAIDGNVIRVISRVLSKNLDIKEIKTILTPLFPDLNRGDFTESLMELGALVCLPQNPSCNQCPLKNICQSYQNNTQSDFPAKKKKNISPTSTFDVYVVINNDCILLSQDDTDNLLKGQYRLPFRIKSETSAPILKTKHVFSHKIWKMDVYKTNSFISNSFENWVSIHKLKELHLITAHKKILKNLGFL